MNSDDRASSELASEIMANADGLNAGEWFELGRRQGYLEGKMAALEERKGHDHTRVTVTGPGQSTQTREMP